MDIWRVVLIFGHGNLDVHIESGRSKKFLRLRLASCLPLVKLYKQQLFTFISLASKALDQIRSSAKADKTVCLLKRGYTIFAKPYFILFHHHHHPVFILDSKCATRRGLMSGFNRKEMPNFTNWPLSLLNKEYSSPGYSVKTWHRFFSILLSDLITTPSFGLLMTSFSYFSISP